MYVLSDQMIRCGWIRLGEEEEEDDDIDEEEEEKGKDIWCFTSF